MRNKKKLEKFREEFNDVVLPTHLSLKEKKLARQKVKDEKYLIIVDERKRAKRRVVQKRYLEKRGSVFKK